MVASLGAVIARLDDAESALNGEHCMLCCAGSSVLRQHSDEVDPTQQPRAPSGMYVARGACLCFHPSLHPAKGELGDKDWVILYIRIPAVNSLSNLCCSFLRYTYTRNQIMLGSSSIVGEEDAGLLDDVLDRRGEYGKD